MQEMHYLIGGGGGDDGRRLRPNQQHQQQNDRNQFINCPRCDSTNTKFCYYNNYNLTQPRHFCKTCRRYWTNGGILRNVPVGGGCRKSKRSSSSSSSSSKSNVADSVANNKLGDSSTVTETVFSSDRSEYESRSGDQLKCPDIFSDGWNLNLNGKDDWLWEGSDSDMMMNSGMKLPEIDADVDQTAQIDVSGKANAVVDEGYWSQLQWTYSDTSHQSFYLP